MAIIKPNNNTISAITALPAAIPTGKILQASQDSLTSQTSTTSTSFIATGLDIDFTPSSASSKVLISFMLNNYAISSNTVTLLTIYRDSTNLGDSSSDTNGVGLLRGYTNVHHGYPMGLTFLDTPNTTSQIHYEVYARTNSGTLWIGGSSSYSIPNYIQCFEVGA
tara:strand:+ start:845 stop:1339 length:495 start_codon:yes stop_codon:yes gene_type:complete